VFFLWASVALAGNRVDELFGEGVFGVTWGMTLDQVRSIHPNGASPKYSLPIAPIYEMQDARPVLEIPRHKKAKISFIFHEDQRLVGISVDFPDCAILSAKLFSILGPPDSTFAGSEWYTEDLYISVNNFPECYMMIATASSIRESVDKSSLGLN
jgi:hypothetical protein